ncbi:MAG: hypothetical protein HKN47_24835 [Pirellulaceae bacterium]|nr:hypothetical protein [Pirellulaceae bacterium]
MPKSVIVNLLHLFAIACLLIVCSGCPRNADNTVTVVLQGESMLTQQVAQHVAPSLLDDANWSHLTWSQWGWGNVKLTIAPVTDPESMRDRIGFGDVTKIEGRTVYVKVSPIRGTLAVIYARTIKVISDLFAR